MANCGLHPSSYRFLIFALHARHRPSVPHRFQNDEVARRLWSEEGLGLPTDRVGEQESIGHRFVAELAEVAQPSLGL